MKRKRPLIVCKVFFQALLGGESRTYKLHGKGLIVTNGRVCFGRLTRVYQIVEKLICH